jgi:hypothetical protein
LGDYDVQRGAARIQERSPVVRSAFGVAASVKNCAAGLAYGGTFIWIKFMEMFLNSESRKVMRGKMFQVGEVSNVFFALLLWFLAFFLIACGYFLVKFLLSYFVEL